MDIAAGRSPPPISIDAVAEEVAAATTEAPCRRLLDLPQTPAARHRRQRTNPSFHTALPPPRVFSAPPPPHNLCAPSPIPSPPPAATHSTVFGCPFVPGENLKTYTNHHGNPILFLCVISIWIMGLT
jgi:hypothetical protein